MELGAESLKTPPDDPSEPIDSTEHSPKALERFVGRTEEMQELLSYAEDARAGRGRLVLIGGEPGIGKTRLATEFAKKAEATGMRVLWGRCWEGDGAPPFWPWVQILRSHFRHDATPPLRGGLHSPAIYHLTPELLSQSPPSTEPQSSDRQISNEDRFRLFDSVAQHLTTNIPDTGIVIVLDDIHWADAPSLLLTDFLAGETTTAPILILGIYRDHELRPGTILHAHISRLLRHTGTTQITMRGLSIHDIVALVPASPPTDTLSDSFLSTLHLRTQGNPFFLIELFRMVVPPPFPSALIPAPNSELPTTILALLETLIRPISLQCRALLTTASALGPDVTALILGSLLQLPCDSISALLDEAISHHLLRHDPKRNGYFEFPHSLIRDALYLSLTLSERAALHLQLALRLEADLRNDTDPRIVALAHHYFNASHTSSDATAKALTYALLAAPLACNRLAYEEAILQYERALTLLPQPCDPRLQCTLQIALGDALACSGDWKTSQTHFSDAFASAHTLASPSLMAQAAIGLKGMGRAALPPNQTAIRALRTALEELHDGDLRLRARVTTALSTSLYFDAASGRDHELASTAVSLATQLGDTQILADALEAQILDTWRPDSIEDMLSMATTLLHTGDHANDPELIFRARIFRYAALRQLDSPEADTELSLCSDLAHHLKSPRSLWQVLLAQASHALVSGNLPLSDSLSQRTRLLGSRFHDATAEHHLGLHLFSSARLRHSLAKLPLVFEPLLSSAPYYPLPRVALAHYEAVTGTNATARSTLAPLLERNPLMIPKDAFYLITLCILADTAYVLRDRDLAERLIPIITPYSKQIAIGGWGSAIEGSVAHFVGLLELARDHLPEAIDNLTLATRINSTAGFPLLHARSQVALANAIIQQGDIECRPNATSLLHTASHTYERATLSSRASEIRSLIELIPTETHRDIHARTPPSPLIRLPTILFETGNICAIHFANHNIRLVATKGLRQLAFLLLHPDQSVPALLLARIDKAGQCILNISDPANTRTYSFDEGSTGDSIDQLAIAQFREELTTLNSELEDAKRNNDHGRTPALMHQIEWLERTLATSLGLRGQPRRAGSSSERARVSVRNNLTAAISTIAHHHDSLARHLTASLKTGALCTYSPERPTKWSSQSSPVGAFCS